MARRRNPLVAALVGYLARLRFPRLFVLAAVLFGVDLWVPDLIPFVDEILLGLGTAMLGSWRRYREETREAGRLAEETATEGEVATGETGPSEGVITGGDRNSARHSSQSPTS